MSEKLPVPGRGSQELFWLLIGLPPADLAVWLRACRWGRAVADLERIGRAQFDTWYVGRHVETDRPPVVSRRKSSSSRRLRVGSARARRGTPVNYRLRATLLCAWLCRMHDGNGYPCVCVCVCVTFCGLMAANWRRADSNGEAALTLWYWQENSLTSELNGWQYNFAKVYALRG